MSRALGSWSALGIVVAVAVFTVCFAAIPLTAPFYLWTDLDGYLAYRRAHGQVFQHAAMLAMRLCGPLVVILLSSIHDHAREERRPLARISLCCGASFAALTGGHSFVPLTAVRLGLAGGEVRGLEQVVQANPLSAVNLLGRALFLGLASLFAAPRFAWGGRERAIRCAFPANGTCGLPGGVGDLLASVPLVFPTLDLGMGGAVLVAAIALCALFRRAGRTTAGPAAVAVAPPGAAD